MNIDHWETEIDRARGSFPTELSASGVEVHDSACRVVATFVNLWQAEALVLLVDDFPLMLGAWQRDVDTLYERDETAEEYRERIMELSTELRAVKLEITGLKTRLALATRESI